MKSVDFWHQPWQCNITWFRSSHIDNKWYIVNSLICCSRIFNIFAIHAVTRCSVVRLSYRQMCHINRQYAHFLFICRTCCSVTLLQFLNKGAI